MSNIYNNKTRILIIKPEQQAAVGFIVDEVKEVINLGDEDIERSNGPQDDKNTYIFGVGKHDEGLISLLNIATVISEKDTDK